MNLDYDYMASIIDVFINSDKAYLSIYDLKDAGINFEIDEYTLNNKFLFHMQKFMDSELISGLDGRLYGLKSIGITKAYNSLRKHTIEKTKIRLTQNGHDFAKALSNEEVLSKIKIWCRQDIQLKTVFNYSQALLYRHYNKLIVKMTK